MTSNNPQPTILITGGSGFAGSHLIEALVGLGQTDVHTTIFGQAPDYLAGMLPESNIHRVDLTDYEAVSNLIQKLRPDQIYHLASFAFVGESFDRGREVLQNNILLQHSLLEAVFHHAPKARVLVVGSAEEYGTSEPAEVPISENHPFRPVNPYAVSKITQDMLAYAYAVSYKLDLVRVRPFNHIGERQTGAFAVPAFAQQIVAIERGQQDSLKVGNLEGERDFTDVKDIAQAYCMVMEKGQTNEVYNLGSGKGVKMTQVVEMLSDLAKVPIKIETDESRMRPLDIPRIVADNSKIRSLGWEPKIPLNDSLSRVLEYWRSSS
jgi:GDP-4-dehydro-6-deoxy-D-mannose reductase